MTTIEERREKARLRRASTRKVYQELFGSTRLLRGPEKRKYNSKRRKLLAQPDDRSPKNPAELAERLDTAAELLDNLTPYPGKSCGSCTACCSTMAVKELGLPNWTRCRHLRSPPDAAIGCSIYDGRPPSCRVWICGWMAADWSDDYRPDRCGVVVDPIPELIWLNGKELPAARLWVQPGYEDSFNRDPVQSLVLSIAHAGVAVLWDMAPQEDGQKLARVMWLNPAGEFGISQPVIAGNTGVSEAERSFRAMQQMK